MASSIGDAAKMAAAAAAVEGDSGEGSGEGGKPLDKLKSGGHIGLCFTTTRT